MSEQRLQKIISAAGLASRRAAEGMLSAGRVTVNGVPAALGQSADAEKDDIRLDGVPVKPVRSHTYIMLNKPRGFVTTLSDEKGRRTVAELVKGAGVRLYPVGRLDLNTEGLLIMTDDGELANCLMHPSHEVDKVYRAEVSGAEPKRAAAQLGALRELEGRAIAPARVSVTESGGARFTLEITIHEGRNRQVRKMCAAAGLKVHRLVRVAEGPLTLGALPSGKWRALTAAELASLRGAV
ncbi:MAG: rRNA pseudouridine synthase [Oscillospiraceae bacterium]|nr:rRNA pseudouridine synthase [Oscillospiraceae bacterium]